MSETSGRRLRAWLLLALEGLDGSAPRRDVHALVKKLFGDEFSHEDRAPRQGRRGEPAWQNNLDSLYDKMKKTGHLKPSTHGGNWTLDDPGLLELLALSPVKNIQEPVAESSLMEDFKPKDSTDYLSHVRGQVLIKTREHELVLKSYGEAIAATGWKPITSVHPRDLELHRDDTVCLVEVKMVYKGNATHAVREAVAQLLEYRHFHYAADSQPVILAVFSESVGAAYVRYMQSLGVASVWRTTEGWNGSSMAAGGDLVP